MTKLLHIACSAALFFAVAQQGHAVKIQTQKMMAEVSFPSAALPVIDGTIGEEEWQGARRDFFADGSELFQLRFGDELYIGIRANTPGMIAGNIFIHSGNRITIHHASGALGTAVYRQEGDAWRLLRDFSWRCRRFDDSDAARSEREAFWDEENWIAANSLMGAPHELEYRIRVPDRPFHLAANFLRAADPTVKVPWPSDFSDDTIKATPGGMPPTLHFSPDKWVLLGPLSTRFPVLHGPYLGQKPPGPAPEIFAPGTLSLGFHEHNIAISPDGREIFIVAASADFSQYVIMNSKLENDAWTMPEVAPFSGGRNDGAPAFSPDGKRLYFSSRRPHPAAGASADDFDIWYVERRGDSWTEAMNLGDSVNTVQHEVNPSVAADGTIVFQRAEKLGLQWDLFMASAKNGTYGVPEKLPAPVNSEANEAGPFIAPDRTYLLFQSNRPGSLGIMDIYIAFRTRSGGWSDPVNLGDKVNSPYSDWGPVVSPEGKYLFFSSFRNVQPLALESPDYFAYMKSRLGTPVPGKGTLYWVEAGMIAALMLERGKRK